MESGAQSTLPLAETAQGYNAVYEDVAYLTGCLAQANISYNANASETGSAANVSVQANDTAWQCIKALPAENLLNASLAVSQLPAFAGAYVASHLDLAKFGLADIVDVFAGSSSAHRSITISSRRHRIACCSKASSPDCRLSRETSLMSPYCT